MVSLLMLGHGSPVPNRPTSRRLQGRIPLASPSSSDRFASTTDTLRTQVRSIESGRALQAVTAAAATLNDVETRALEHIRSGQDFMAADLIFSDGRAADNAIASGLRMIRAAEIDAYSTARADALDSSWTIGAAVAVLWVVGAILLVRVPAPPVVPEEQVAIAPTQSFLTIAATMHEVSPPAGPDLQAA